MVEGGAWASEGSGRAAKHASGPSQVGDTTPERPRSNSPTQLLPRSRRPPPAAARLRAAAQVTGALFTSRRHTRDACWDVLISCRIALRAGTT